MLCGRQQASEATTPPRETGPGFFHILYESGKMSSDSDYERYLEEESAQERYEDAKEAHERQEAERDAEEAVRLVEYLRAFRADQMTGRQLKAFEAAFPGGWRKAKVPAVIAAAVRIVAAEQ
jgi:hypothetical protein